METGSALFKIGAWGDADQSYLKARQAAIDAKRVDLQARAQLAIGAVSDRFGDEMDAAQAANETFFLLNEMQSSDLMAQTLEARSRYLTKLQYGIPAAKDAVRALSLANSNHNTALELKALTALAAAKLVSGEFQSAEILAVSALAFCGSEDQQETCKAENLRTLSAAFDKEGRYRESCYSAFAANAFGIRDTDLTNDIEGKRLIVRCLTESGRADLAIPIALDAVNIHQRERRLVAQQLSDLRSSFAWKAAGAYRDLAEILFTRGALGEGIYVLELLKNTEVGTDTSSQEFEELPLTSADRAVVSAVNNLSAAVVAQFEQHPLNNIVSGPSPSGAQRERLLAMFVSSINARSVVADLITSVDSTLSKGPTRTLPRSHLQSAVQSLGPGVMAITTLVTNDHIGLAITSGNSTHYITLTENGHNLSKIELLSEIEPAIGKLHASREEPWTSLRHLHDVILGPLAPYIAQAAKQSPDGIPTLLWSLDNFLRFLPVNALFDGQQFFVEQARNVFIVPGDFVHNRRVSYPKRETILAAGKTSFYNQENFADLDTVKNELYEVAKDPNVLESKGLLNGTILLDEAFTSANLAHALESKPTILHLSTHFVHESGDPDKSYLITTDNKDSRSLHHLTLSSFQNVKVLDLSNIHLVTLSACSASEPDETLTERDVDSLADVFRKRGAQAVIAPLWRADAIASKLFLVEFYRIWTTRPELGKLEALRLAQVEMLNGEIGRKMLPDPGADASPDPHVGYYAHPYYWASFQLNENPQ